MTARVVGTWVGGGVTDTGAAGKSITITASFPTIGDIDRMETYFFVTYNSLSRLVMKTSHYRLVAWDNKSADGATRSVALLHKTDAGDDTVNLELTVSPSVPVRWRVVAVRVSGILMASQIIGAGWRKLVNFADLPATGLGLLFLGWTTGDLNFPNGANEMEQIASYPPAGQTGDTGKIVALTWDSNSTKRFVRGGPWYTGMILFHDPPPVVPRPVPTRADNFWADRACCECADVFLINDANLATYWDVPGSAAMIKLDTLLLNYTDSDGTRWSLTDIDGWWTLPQPELPELKRSGYLDGSFPVDGRYGSRQITVSGAFLPAAGVSLAVPRQRFLRSLDAVREGALFVVKEPVWAKQSWVYLEGQPKLSTKSRSQLTIFEFVLRAVDPIKYHAGSAGVKTFTNVDQNIGYKLRSYRPLDGDDIVNNTYDSDAINLGQRFRPTTEPPLLGTVTVNREQIAPNPYRRYNQNAISSGLGSAVNAGTTTVFPRFYIYGPCSNPVIRNETTGQKMQFICTLTANEMLVVDCYWRSVVVRERERDVPKHPLGDVTGENRRWYLDFKSQWIGLLPGGNAIRFTASTLGSGSYLKTVYRSGWLG